MEHPGLHAVPVAYSGDSDFNPATSLLARMAGFADRTTILSVRETGLPGYVVVGTVVVPSASANAEGVTATFKDGGTPLRAMSLSSDSASFDVILAPGTRVLYAHAGACRGPGLRPPLECVTPRLSRMPFAGQTLRSGGTGGARRGALQRADPHVHVVPSSWRLTLNTLCLASTESTV